MARVELPDVVDGLVVRRDLTSVLTDLGGIPVAGLRGRVVERLVVDRGVAGLAAGLVECEADALHHGARLVLRGALEREARVDVDGAAAARAAGRRTAAAARVGAAVVVVAASGDAECQLCARG